MYSPIWQNTLRAGPVTVSVRSLERSLSVLRRRRRRAEIVSNCSLHVTLNLTILLRHLMGIRLTCDHRRLPPNSIRHPASMRPKSPLVSSKTTPERKYSHVRAHLREWRNSSKEPEWSRSPSGFILSLLRPTTHPLLGVHHPSSSSPPPLSLLSHTHDNYLHY